MLRKIIPVLFFLIILPQRTVSTEINEVSIAWERGLKPPYLMLDANNKPTGIAVDIINEIFKRNHIKTTQIVVPWKRCLRYIKEGKIDIVPNSSYKEDRAEYAYYTEPFYETHLVLYYKKSRFKNIHEIQPPDSLIKYRLGGVLGFNYKQYNGKARINTDAKSRVNLIKMLKAGRIDFAILQKEIMLALQKQGTVDLTDLDYIPDPFRPINISHILTVMNPKGKKLKQILDDGIQELTTDGTIRLINERYLKK